MSGMDSTVEVVSRSTWIFLSAGARPAPAAQMMQPESSSISIMRSFVTSACQPGMDSSLSNVPPVWPRPRPDSCGTATPKAVTSGATGSAIVSPTTPVACLFAVTVLSESKTHGLARVDHRLCPAGNLSAVHAIHEHRHIERGHLLIAFIAMIAMLSAILGGIGNIFGQTAGRSKASSAPSSPRSRGSSACRGRTASTSVPPCSTPPSWAPSWPRCKSRSL